MLLLFQNENLQQLETVNICFSLVGTSSVTCAPVSRAHLFKEKKRNRDVYIAVSHYIARVLQRFYFVCTVDT